MHRTMVSLQNVCALPFSLSCPYLPFFLPTLSCRNKKSITDIDLAGKRVFIRVDFNVPLDKKTGAITNNQVTASCHSPLRSISYT